jgi:hypothetical protein
MTLDKTTLLTMTILITLNMGKITYNDIYYNKCNMFYLLL